MGISPRPLLGLGNVHPGEHVDGHCHRLALGEALVQRDRLADLAPDRVERIERGHRLLKDHRDVVAADGLHLGLVEREKVAAFETNGSAHYAAGRIGDSPLIGAATYAQNGICAVSATGHGEYFIRVAVAKTICARVELAGESVGDAARSALDQVAELGGDGGVVVIDGNGQYEYVFNSKGMYRGMIDPDGMETAIFEQE